MIVISPSVGAIETPVRHARLVELCIVLELVDRRGQIGVPLA